MAIISFEGYKVLDMEYHVNEDYTNDAEDQIKNNLLVSFGEGIDSNDSEVSLVKLGIELGEKGNNQPFYMNVVIEGVFKYNLDEDEHEIGIDTLLKENATAILYPYLRSTVSSLSILTNSMSTFILPTINVQEILRENN